MIFFLIFSGGGTRNWWQGRRDWVRLNQRGTKSNLKVYFSKDYSNVFHCWKAVLWPVVPLRVHAITVKLSSKYCKNTSQLVAFCNMMLCSLDSYAWRHSVRVLRKRKFLHCRCLGLRQFGCAAKWCHQKCQTNFSS